MHTPDHLQPNPSKNDVFLISELAVPGTLDLAHMRSMEEAARMLAERDAGKHPSLAPSDSPDLHLQDVLAVPSFGVPDHSRRASASGTHPNASGGGAFVPLPTIIEHPEEQPSSSHAQSPHG